MRTKEIHILETTQHEEGFGSTSVHLCVQDLIFKNI